MIPVRGRTFSVCSSKTLIKALGPTQSPAIHWLLVAATAGLKQPGREADHSVIIVDAVVSLTNALFVKKCGTVILIYGLFLYCVCPMSYSVCHISLWSEKSELPTYRNNRKSNECTV